MRMKEVNQICYNVCCVIFVIVCWNVQIHAVNAHFVGASKRRRRKNEKKKNHLWQNWHRYRWSFFHFSLDDCDDLVCCRKYNGYKQICELHGIVEFQKEKLEKMVLNDFEKMWNWDNDEHSDRFFFDSLFLWKKNLPSHCQRYQCPIKYIHNTFRYVFLSLLPSVIFFCWIKHFRIVFCKREIDCRM